MTQLAVVSDVSDMLRDIGVLDPLSRPVRDQLQPPTSVRGMFTDLLADGHRLRRRSGEGVKNDASRDTCQAAHNEPFPYTFHVIPLLFPCPHP
jgi:hypothetical protein